MRRSFLRCAATSAISGSCGVAAGTLPMALSIEPFVFYQAQYGVIAHADDGGECFEMVGKARLALAAQGGAGVLVTGNVMVAESGKGSINDVVISDDSSLEMLKNGRKPARKTTRCLLCKSTMRANSRLR